MPTYQYTCFDCGTPLEVVQSFTEPARTECPACGGRLRKVFSAVGVVFKGSGFYRNDSRVSANGAGGRDGSDSRAGRDGKDGKDGKDGTDRKDRAGEVAAKAGKVGTESRPGADSDARGPQDKAARKSPTGDRPATTTPSAPGSGRGAPSSTPSTSGAGSKRSAGSSAA